MIGISEKIMTNYKYNSHKRYYNYLGISFLYDLLNLKKFHLGAETAIDWNICKYIYREGAYKISLEEYLQQKNINLKFSQFTHYLGLNFHFSIPLYQHQNKFIIGMRGGYVYKMHKYPIIRTDHNRVINSHRPIDLDNYKVGIYMGFQFSH